MRATILAIVSAALLATAAMADDTPTSLLNKRELQSVETQPLAPIEAPTVIVTAPPMKDMATRDFGPNYRSYVPMEIKSSNPDVVRAWNAEAHPGNGNHMTPEGLACAADADCFTPLGCFNRADSGMVPRMLCAVPPNK